MKHTLIFIVSVMLAIHSIKAQESGDVDWIELSQCDSIDFVNYWNSFVEVIEQKDTSGVRSISLSKIDCDLCVTINWENYVPQDDYIIPIDTLLQKNIEDILKSQLWKAIKMNRIHYGLRVIYDFPRRNLPDGYGRNLYLYEAWIQTFLPDEWVKGHEGQSHAFQFVKIGNVFKFYGMTSIP